VQLLPVGSNIAPPGGRSVNRDPRLAVLFGLQGSRLHALEKMAGVLRTSAAAGRIRKLVTIGGGDDPDARGKERDLLTALDFPDGAEQRGPLPEAAVSELLLGATFGISAQDPLSITKSGSFMAYAAHGLNVLSPFASASQPEPLCWATHPSELVQGVADELLRSRAESMRGWQERTCSWPHIAEQFATALRLDFPPRTATTQP
jgi:hypothetical protein